ncbi:CgeB family protein [Desulfoluna spongiiphila]|uniref:Glycosyl transferases group 1 n=1 Tax=Desulfoluna spongiiphila TaxID=419481 RepID=A0A1G5JRU5_9BACT|nr:glycosyltransferase [Desulfoluna spongiiphila]SCY90399.1 Glycosyl transferases group 1 [Desulfoluna spongiiphila]
MKILVVGDWHSELHEEPVLHAFESLGHQTFRFSWHNYFMPHEEGVFASLAAFVGRVQNKLIAGQSVARINADFISMVFSVRPDVVFVYRGTHITSESLKVVKAALPHIVLVGYNNDDPFAKGHSYLLWRHFLKAIPVYDLMLAYRHHNLDDFKGAGAQRVQLLRSWFVQERNHPVKLTLSERERYSCDVVFVGHYEPDGRLEMLETIVKQGFSLKVFGPDGWDSIIRRSPWLSQLSPVRPLWGEDYNKALCGAKVSLCFLSKLNRDTYTRRCFEIPAARSVLMAEYTDDLATLYKEDREAVFFSSTDELIEKLHQYIRNDELRHKVAQAGFERVYNDKHDVASRMQQVVTWISEFELEKEG